MIKEWKQRYENSAYFRAAQITDIEIFNFSAIYIAILSILSLDKKNECLYLKMVDWDDFAV